MDTATREASSPIGTRRLGSDHLALLGALLAIWTWAAIDPVFRDDWWLEYLLAFADSLRRRCERRREQS